MLSQYCISSQQIDEWNQNHLNTLNALDPDLNNLDALSARVVR